MNVGGQEFRVTFIVGENRDRLIESDNNLEEEEEFIITILIIILRLQM